MVGLGDLGIRGRKRAGYIGVCALKQSNRRRKRLIHWSGAQTAIKSFPEKVSHLQGWIYCGDAISVRLFNLKIEAIREYESVRAFQRFRLWVSQSFIHLTQFQKVTTVPWPTIHDRP
jgi:hypothetical protein